MKVYRGLDSVDPPLTGVTLTIGNFDGVHRGHQQIFAQTCLCAARLGTAAFAMTFDPSPRAVIDPANTPPLLTGLDERLAQIAQCGLRGAVVVETDATLLALSPDAFVERVLVRQFRPKAIVEGQGWRFGRHRGGDIQTLTTLGEQHGFIVQVVPDLTIQLDPGQAQTISSTLIRQLLSGGQVDQAAACLGRPYALLGVAKPGAKRGQALGYPTANLDTGAQMVPADGVYAGRALVDGAWHTAGISIGNAPTFEDSGGESVVEAHLLDYDGHTLYGSALRVEFLRWLRSQEAFADADALRGQIQRDLRHIRAIAKTTTWTPTPGSTG